MYRTFPRRLLFALLIALAWLGFVTEGSHALLSASTTLAGSSITTGTAALQISNSQSGSSTTFADSRPGFSLSLVPGSSQDRYLFLKNTGSAGVDLDLAAAATATDLGSGDLFPHVSLQFTPVDSNGNPTGPAVQSSLQGMQQSLSLGLTLPSGATQRFLLRTSLDADYILSNQSLGYDLSFSGIQHYVAT